MYHTDLYRSYNACCNSRNNMKQSFFDMLTKTSATCFCWVFSKKELFSKSLKETEKPSPSLGSQVYDDNGHIWWQYDGMLGLFWCEDSKKTDSDSYSCPGGDPAMKIMAEEHPGKTKRGGWIYPPREINISHLGKKNILFNVLVPRWAIINQPRGIG